MNATITIEEFYAELRRLDQAQPEGSTIKEMMAATGMSDDRVRRLLAAAKADGRLIVGRRRAESLSGTVTTIPTYRISAESEHRNGA